MTHALTDRPVPYAKSSIVRPKGLAVPEKTVGRKHAIISRRPRFNAVTDPFLAPKLGTRYNRVRPIDPLARPKRPVCLLLHTRYLGSIYWWVMATKTPAHAHALRRTNKAHALARTPCPAVPCRAVL